ncbi:ABC transporter permease [Virgibacillus flavescens]|uniref:ABC transporter permease n=1 Tax=Virgibacillus flavescens TaxID=1611422 RepID=UPI003D330854
MFLAFKELSQSKIRYTLISLIMIAILFLVFFVTGLANGLSFADSSSLQSLKADYIVMNEEAEGALINSSLSEEQVKTIQGNLETDSTPLSITMSSLKRANEQDIDVTYFSVHMDSYKELEVVEGKEIEELEGNEVIADQSIKRQGIKINDKVTDEATNKTMIIAGFVEEQTYKFLPVVYTDYELGMGSIYSDKSSYNAVIYNGSKANIEGFDTFTKEQTVKSMPGYKETQGSLMMIVVFLFIISAFVSTVFFYVITIQKINQFGVLKAIGATTRYIAKSIIIQVFLLTVIGLVFSSLAIYGMTQIIPEEMPFRTSPELIAGTAVLFLILNLAGSLLSVLKVAKTDSLEAIGRVE